MKNTTRKAIKVFWTYVITVATVGWIANVVKLAGLFGGEDTQMFVARAVGVFLVPLGSVLGFF
jgi:hypothetical protein